MYLCNVHMRNNEALRSEHDHIRRENKERSRTLIAVQAPLICLKFCRSTRFIVMVRSTRENPFGTAFADPDYFPAASRRFLNLSRRPPASTNFCLPVKNGWHLEQISTCISSCNTLGLDLSAACALDGSFLIIRMDTLLHVLTPHILVFCVALRQQYKIL